MTHELWTSKRRQWSCAVMRALKAGLIDSRKVLRKGILTIPIATGCFVSNVDAQPSTITVRKIELVQAVQDAAGSVPLIGGKATIVRVYVTCVGPRTSIRARLLVQGPTGEKLGILASGNAINIDPSQTANQAISSINRTLNFVLIDRMTQPGSLVLKLQDIVDSRSGQKLQCDNCDSFQSNKTFQPSVSLLVRIVLFSYIRNSPPIIPQDADVLNLKSWLGRAYPISNLQVSTEVAQLPGDFDFSCNMANAVLAVLRANDIKSGMDPKTHLIGLVSNKSDYMAGCSSGLPTLRPDPSVVASAPSGRSNDPPSLVPINRERGSSRTFADWYGAHELAHTFGRLHPGKCADNSSDDPVPVYDDRGNIAKDSEAFAYDVGDDSDAMKSANMLIRPRFMSGTHATELMTYCDQPNWPSVYTYKGIYERLNAEANMTLSPQNQPVPIGAAGMTSGAEPSFVRNVQTAGPPAESVDKQTQRDTTQNRSGQTNRSASGFEHIVARINLTKATGQIVGAIQSSEAISALGEADDAAQTDVAPPPAKALLRFRSSDGTAIAQFAAKIRPDTDTKPGNDQFALLQATVPRPPGAVTLELLLDDKVIDRRDIQDASPKVIEVPANPNGTRGKGASTVLQWTATHPSGAQLTYTVQGSRDGKKWTSLAAGLTRPYLKLLPQQQRPWFRVIANDGFNDSEPVIIQSPKRR
jgi:hypothetical protein